MHQHNPMKNHAVLVVLGIAITCFGCAPAGWTSANSGVTDDLRGVWGSAPNDVHAVGGLSVFRHWDGTRWDISPINPKYSGNTSNLFSVWGRNSTYIFAGGENMTWNWRQVDLKVGYVWSIFMSSMSKAQIYSFAKKDATTDWGVADDGVIFTLTPPDSYPSITVTTANLRGVWSDPKVDNGVAWAVGFQGTILKYDGTNWAVWVNPNKSPATDVTKNLYGIWGASPEELWAVGAGGTILRWDDANWNKLQNSPTTADLYAIHGSGPHDIWAVGAGGVIIHWNGTDWKTATSGTTKDLKSVWVDSSKEAWAVGLGGTALHYKP